MNFGKNARFAYTKWQFFENRRFTCTKRPLCANVSVSPARNKNIGPHGLLFYFKVSNWALSRKRVSWQFLMASPICREIHGPKTLYFTAFSNKPCVLPARNDDFRQKPAPVPPKQAQKKVGQKDWAEHVQFLMVWRNASPGQLREHPSSNGTCRNTLLLKPCVLLRFLCHRLLLLFLLPARSKKQRHRVMRAEMQLLQGCWGCGMWCCSQKLCQIPHVHGYQSGISLGKLGVEKKACLLQSLRNWLRASHEPS